MKLSKRWNYDDGRQMLSVVEAGGSGFKVVLGCGANLRLPTKQNNLK